MASVDDDSKVMDVSRPGKGKVVATSRPVVAPVSDTEAKDTDVKSIEVEEAKEAAAPSATRRVIQPLNEIDRSSDDKEEESPSSSDSLPTPKPDEDNPIAPAAPPADASGAASVDEMAKAAESKRLAAEKSKEEAKKEEEVQSLIESKKYVVPISHGGPGGKRKNLIFIIILIVVILGAGAYFYLTQNKDKNDMADDAATRTQQPVQETGQPTGEEKKSEENPTTDNPAPEDDAPDVSPTAKADDDDRRNEIKNLQTKLETYFGDNDSYPLSLSDLSPQPTEDETTGPSNDAYVYTSNGETYTLTAKLSDGTEYTVQSVNQ